MIAVNEIDNEHERCRLYLIPHTFDVRPLLKAKGSEADTWLTFQIHSTDDAWIEWIIARNESVALTTSGALPDNVIARFTAIASACARYTTLGEALGTLRIAWIASLLREIGARQYGDDVTPEHVLDAVALADAFGAEMTALRWERNVPPNWHAHILAAVLSRDRDDALRILWHVYTGIPPHDAAALPTTLEESRVLGRCYRALMWNR